MFLREIFPDKFIGPLTTGIDKSLPSEVELHWWALMHSAMHRGGYVPPTRYPTVLRSVTEDVCNRACAFVISRQVEPYE